MTERALEVMAAYRWPAATVSESTSIFLRVRLLWVAMSIIKDAIEEFAARLHTLIEGHAMERARAAVLGAFGATPKRGPGRPPKAKALGSLTAITSIGKKARKKPPRQLCPVPGCKNPAAPVFGMVCAKHKDVAKSKIKKFREARRAKKEKAAA
jgi:hypothetical protein